MSTETAIQRLFREWEAVRERTDKCGLTDEEGEKLDAISRPIEATILAEPATDIRDLAIKVLVNSGEGCFALADDLTLECATLAGPRFRRAAAVSFRG